MSLINIYILNISQYNDILYNISRLCNIIKELAYASLCMEIANYKNINMQLINAGTNSNRKYGYITNDIIYMLFYW